MRQQLAFTQQFCRQTDGLRGVVSRAAIGKRDVQMSILHHSVSFPVYSDER